MVINMIKKTKINIIIIIVNVIIHIIKINIIIK